MLQASRGHVSVEQWAVLACALPFRCQIIVYHSVAGCCPRVCAFGHHGARAFKLLFTQSAYPASVGHYEDLSDVADADAFILEEIVDSRIVKGRLQFEIRWRGYAEQTWEPADVVATSPLLLQRFRAIPRKAEWRSTQEVIVLRVFCCFQVLAL
eukprot:gnl/Spiro4/29657_TR14547_c1_g2_i1.p1 gnl/Spiro4/29657_TR14547_c1_g2~~gnl/Spiro4/29657_TR14547_c1_g2_i1.p1  ORF type:complete len:154 (+),score=15.16 gnl/Spiro4/29657_TR14547_c1_g2_i1:410-871(+)